MAKKTGGKITKRIRQMCSSEAFFTIKYSWVEKEVHKHSAQSRRHLKFQGAKFSMLRTKKYYKILWHGEQE